MRACETTAPVRKLTMAPEAQAQPAISVLIPVYNEERILEESVRDIIQGADPLEIPYEVVLCENGSRDRTVEVAEGLCSQFPQLRLLRPLSENLDRLVHGLPVDRVRDAVFAAHGERELHRISPARLRPVD